MSKEGNFKMDKEIMKLYIHEKIRDFLLSHNIFSIRYLEDFLEYFVSYFNDKILCRFDNFEREYVVYNYKLIEIIKIYLLSLYKLYSKKDIEALVSNQLNLYNHLDKYVWFSSNDISVASKGLITKLPVNNVNVLVDMSLDEDEQPCLNITLFKDNKLINVYTAYRILVDNENRICIYQEYKDKYYVFKIYTTKREILYGIVKDNIYYGFSSKSFVIENMADNHKEVVNNKAFNYPENSNIYIFDTDFNDQYALVKGSGNKDNIFCYTYDGEYLLKESKKRRFENYLKSAFLNNIDLYNYAIKKAELFITDYIINIDFIEKTLQNYPDRTNEIQARIEICKVFRKILVAANIQQNEDIAKIYVNMQDLYLLFGPQITIDCFVIILDVLNFIYNYHMSKQFVEVLQKDNLEELKKFISSINYPPDIPVSEDNSFYFLIKLEDSVVIKGDTSIITSFIEEIKKIHPEYVNNNEYLHDSWFQGVIRLNGSVDIKNQCYLLFEMRDILDNKLKIKDKYYLEVFKTPWDNEILLDKFAQEAFKNDKSLHL